MIHRLIEWSLRNRFLVLCGSVLLFAWGWKALDSTPVDAIPDLSENQVIVFADWPGRSPQEVEDQVTYPLSANLQGLAGVKTVRANSMFGFSLITVIFEDRTDNYFARARVLERLNYLTQLMPRGVTPQLGPDATGLGWVYQYYLEVDPTKAPNGGYDLGQLRALQDWFVRYQLNSVAGVAEVASIGGFVREYQIEVSSLKMRDLGVTLEEVVTAVTANNLNVGGKTIDENGMEFVVRGVGLIRNTTDLENIVLKSVNGTPVYLRQVAQIRLGGDYRRGALDVEGREVVGGIVVMRTGENAMAVIERVKARLAQLAPSLPPGVTIRPFYDRSDLISRTIATLRDALVEEIILVTLVHIIFLFHFRSILIVTIPLPFSILISFILMNQFGISSNIMSLAGIAIAIGVLVDAGIVMTENVIRHCERAEEQKRSALGTSTDQPGAKSAGRLTPAETMACTLTAARQVGRPIFFAMAIIILAFLPVFVLGGQEGKLFRPLAFTKTFACLGATFLAVTLVPVLCSLLVRGPFHAEHDNWVMRVLLRIYDPALDWALRHPRLILSAATLLLIAALTLALGLPRPVREQIALAGAPPRIIKAVSGFGKEFMPTLNEGSLLFMPVLLPSTSLTEVKRIMAWQDQVIRQFPQVESVAGKLGRAETATDPAPVEMIETTIMLHPEYLTTNRTVLGLLKIPWTVRNPVWPEGMTRERLVGELSHALTAVPGYVPGFLQPIENRVLMIATGIRAQLGVKVLGDNLESLQQQAFAVQRVLETVRGAVGVAPSRVQGKPYLEIEVDRPAMARYGLSAETVLNAVEVGIGGRTVATTIEGRERFPIQVRLERDERDDLEKLGAILVAAPNGMQIPLGQVAKIRRTTGPNEIASENGRLRVFVQANVQGRDLGGFVEEVRRRITAEIVPQLPKGITIEYSGQYEELLRAERTLRIIVPVSLLIIFLLLYVVYHSAKEAAHVILAVPFALSGSVFLQAWLGYNFSVAVWIGYISLFGIAIQTGVVMVVYLEEALAKKRSHRGGGFSAADLVEAVKSGARLRLRPKVMTVATTIASLLPIMWSTRAGAEVMKPIATPVIGGSISSLIHILIVTPVIFLWLRQRELRKGKGDSLADS
ncbi:MAG TPA: CusA/CzcA family heavy metal efflux RND transporter [Verrucomicrobiota bacterium]|nr:CusA/CzcA family heavy metal efflux RND transporter [Verrucomicrobiales bacterium]HRI13156.1 CusA/CzcA family heavy metal efflux RND transporter [Verrucomicrobiota bacterium]